MLKRLLFSVLLAACAPCMSAWADVDSEFTVRECGEASVSGAATLRSAVAYAEAHPAACRSDGTRRITFALAGTRTVTLTNDLALGTSLAIDGGAAGIVLTRAAASGDGRLITHTGGALTLLNLELAGGATTNAGGAVLSVGGLAVSNCVFRANRAARGGAVCLTNGVGAVSAAPFLDAVFRDCTFVSNAVTSVGGAVAADAGTNLFVNCTFSANAAASGAGLAVNAGLTRLYASTLAENAATATGNGWWTADGAALETCNVLTAAEALVTPPNVATSGVAHVWYSPRLGTATTNGVPLVLDFARGTYGPAASGAVAGVLACDQLGEAYRVPTPCGAIGARFTATLSFETDDAAVAAPDARDFRLDTGLPETVPTVSRTGWVFSGWWTTNAPAMRVYSARGVRVAGVTACAAANLTLAARWRNADAALTVTEDVSLEEAVDALVADADLVRSDGTRTVRFAFTNAPPVVALANAIALPSGTAAFTVDGETNGVVIAAGRGERIFTHAGDGLTLRNLVLRGSGTAVAGAGGLVHATGPLVASNCVFAAGAATGNGGALALAPATGLAPVLSDMQDVLVCCAFVGNAAEGDGGAVWLDAAADDAVALFLNDTFSANAAGARGGGLSAARGTARLLNATFSENVAAASGGAVYAGSASKAALANVIAAGDRCTGDADAAEVAADDAATLDVYDCTFGTAVAGAAAGTRLEADVQTNVFAKGGATNVAWVGGVGQVFYGVYSSGTVARAALVTHNADWSVLGLYFPLVSENAPVGQTCEHAPVAFLGTAAQIAALAEDAAEDAANTVDHDQIGGAMRTVGRFLRGAVFGTCAFTVRFDPLRADVAAPAAQDFWTGLPLAAVPVVSAPTAVFLGWYLQDKDGDWTQVFDGDGAPVVDAWPGDNVDTTLYARWVDSDVVFTVNATEGEASATNITLQTALAMTMLYPELRRSDGTREIRFNLPSPQVALPDALVCTAAVTLAINGYNGGRGVVFSGNDGVFDFAGAGTVTLRNLAVTGARTTAIRRADGALVLENCAFSGVSTSGSGAAVALTGGSLVCTNCSFYQASALGSGGAIRAEAAVASLACWGCSFVENAAGIAGGAVSTEAPAVFAHCTFVRNTAASGAETSGAGAVTRRDSLFGSELDAEDVFAQSAAVVTGAVNGVVHAYVVPLAAPEVVDGADACAVPDLLGCAEAHACRGAVRSVLRARYVLDVGAAAYAGDLTNEYPCGAAVTPPAATPAWFGRTFNGWDALYATAPFQSPFVSRALWTCSPTMLTVTDARAEENVEGAVTLLDALRAVHDCPDLVDTTGVRRISFDLYQDEFAYSAPLQVLPGTAPFILDGSNGGRGVLLYAPLDGAGPVIRCDADGVAFHNLSFYGDNGSGVPSGNALEVTGSSVALSNCVFYLFSAPTGAAVRADSGAVQARDCSFSGNTAACGGAVAAASGAFTNCTFAMNVATGAGAVFYTTVQGGTPAAFTACSIGGDAASFAGVDGAAAPVETASLRAEDAAARQELFADACTSRVGTVTHVWYLPHASETVLADGVGGVDELGCAATAPGRGAVRSVYGLVLTLDAGRGLCDGQHVTTRSFLTTGDGLETLPVPRLAGWTFTGWYLADGVTCAYDAEGRRTDVRFTADATLYAHWTGGAAALEVTTGEDGLNRADGLVTLRDAVQYLTDDPTLADADGNRRITRASAVTTIVLTNTIHVAAGTAAFAIDFDGADVVPTNTGAFALIDHAGDDLLLENGNFARGAGLVLASGNLRASNCAFRDGTAAYGGGVRLTGSAIGRFLQCTFAANAATAAGGACYAADASTAFFVNTTFTGNTAPRGGALAADATAGLYVMTSTLVANDATAGAGGALATDGPGAAVAALFAGNTATAGAPDAAVGTGFMLEASTCVTASSGTSAAPATLFANGDAARTAVIRGVTHAYYVPADSSVTADGRWIWYAADGSSLAYSAGDAKDAGEKTVLFGTAARADTCLAEDQLGNVILSAPLRGSILSTQVSLVVTTASDGSGTGTGEVTLRAALQAAAGGLVEAEEDGFRTVTFAPELTASGPAVITLASALPAVYGRIRIQGPVDGSVIIRWTQPGDALTCASTGRLELRNLTFCGGGSDDGSVRRVLVSANGDVAVTDCAITNCTWKSGPLVSLAGGRFAFEQCSFFDNGSSSGTSAGVLVARGGWGRLVNCTFAANAAYAADASAARNPVEFRNACDVDVVNCTFTLNRGHYAAVYVGREDGADLPAVRFVNTLLSDNIGTSDSGYRDVWNDLGEDTCSSPCVTFCHTAFNVVNNLDLFTCIESPGDVRAESAFTEPLVRRTLDGVARAYRRVNVEGAAHGNGCFTVYSAGWTNVAYSAWPTGADRTYLIRRDTAVTARNVVAHDLVGRALGSVVTPGSYATVTDAETSGNAGVMAVNSLADEGDGANAYDTVLSLREAVDFAQTNPTFRDAEGVCRITFLDDCFDAGEAAASIVSAAGAIEVTGFTNGAALVVSGPTNRLVTLDGAAAHRLLFVGAGNRVRFENLVFSNAVSQARGEDPVASATRQGGAVLNAGHFVASNCVFTACMAGEDVSGTAAGGAVCTLDGATTRVVRCTFQACTAAAGGAVATRDGGRTVAVACTFTGNRAAYGNAIASGCGGAVWTEGAGSQTVLVNCTLAGNAAEQSGGAAAATGTDAAVSNAPLKLLASVAVGNTGLAGTNDDFYVENAADFAYVRYGAATVGAQGALNDLAGSEGACTANGLFADIQLPETPLATTCTVGRVTHAIVRLREDLGLEAPYVAADAAWANIVYGTTDDPSEAFDGLARRARVGQGGTLLLADQAGVDTGVPFFGATRETAAQTFSQAPETVDPRIVTSGTPEGLWAAVTNALAHPEWAVDRVITLSFAADVTEIVFREELTLEENAFSAVALRLMGPVTFRGEGSRFFTIGAGNDVRFENVVFADGTAEEVGGAIWTTSSRVTATDCVFRGNTAVDVGAGGYGGAVCSEGESGRCTFIRCTFEDNAADCGKSVYCDDDNLAMIGCTAEGALADEVADGFRAAVEERDGAACAYFNTAADAAAYAVAGETVVLLSADCPEGSSLLLRNGVAVRDDSGGAWQNVLNQALGTRRLANAAAGTDWYSETVASDGSVRSVLNTNAVPAVTSVTLGDAVLSLTPANVKPNLYYGLGAAAEPNGVYGVDAWVQADANGCLPAALTVPRAGEKGFYRVIVTDAP